MYVNKIQLKYLDKTFLTLEYL